MWCSALEKIQPRVVSYEEQATSIREQLAKLLEDEEEWTKAAQTLAGIDLDSGLPILKQCFPLPDHTSISQEADWQRQVHEALLNLY